LSLLQEILGWAQDLPDWQSDAVSRLLVKPEITNEDVEDLYALLKTAHGIPDPKSRRPTKLSANQIPVADSKIGAVELRAIKNLRHVNAIAKDQRLPFAGAGLTVIYGDNGSGKSGYSRVLKKACRARDQAEPILPNAHASYSQAAAEADFEIVVNGAPQEVHWTDGTASPGDLSSIAIFDSRCARAYLDSEDDFSYVPYGLDVFDGLARLCRTLKDQLMVEHAQIAPDLTAFVPLQGPTKVGSLIANLSAETDSESIEVLACVAPEEVVTHAALERSLKQTNAKERANQLRGQAARIDAIATSAVAKGAQVSEVVIHKLRGLAEGYRSAKAAAILAAEQFKEQENLLPGTGGESWRELFEAARKFALESHPDKAFPNLGENAPCPLCQQPLADGASRLERFETFVLQEAEKTVQDRRRALAVEYTPFKNHVLSLNLDDVTYAELEAIDERLAVETRAFEQALSARQTMVVAALQSQQWEGINTDYANPAERLRALAENLMKEVRILEKASVEKTRSDLQTTFSELDARIKLGQVKSAVLSTVGKLRHQRRLIECLAEVKTNAISLKASELAEKVVSKDLADALNGEFAALGVGTLQVCLVSRSERGKTLHKLKLEFAQSRSPGDILSEGEQRAIAIASFLAEVNLIGGSGGVIFDDPVSSLDHRRRDRVARRLALEAKKRQVIVFTHDIYFLCLLAEHAKEAGAPSLTQSLTRRPEGYGVTDPELPFEGRNTAARIGALRNQQQAIAKLYRIGNEQEHRRQTIEAYVSLRMTWERAVEEVLFRQVILRFRKGIETQRLAEVLVEDEDYAQLTEGMTKCSNYPHDKALEAGVTVPAPDELLADINALDAWRTRIEERSRFVGKKRKGGAVAPLAQVAKDQR
jgi:energy-coupling factor transporter ATP-binding protein EcfA2